MSETRRKNGTEWHYLALVGGFHARAPVPSKVSDKQGLQPSPLLGTGVSGWLDFAILCAFVYYTRTTPAFRVVDCAAWPGQVPMVARSACLRPRNTKPALEVPIRSVRCCYPLVKLPNLHTGWLSTRRRRMFLDHSLQRQLAKV
jgi:hypothetical protein